MSDSLRIRKFKIWLSQSESDYKAALISKDNKVYDWSCYQSVQSVEKALKGIISLSGSQPPKTHKLSILYKIISNAGLQLDVNITELRELEAYTYVSRYPFLNPYSASSDIPHEIIGKDEALFANQIVNRLIKSVYLFLNGEKSADIEYSEGTNQHWERQYVTHIINQNIELLRGVKDYKIKKVMLYGSYYRDLSQPKTKTMDLLIIINDSSQGSFIDRTIYFNSLLGESQIPVDCLVYTESEYDQLINVLKDGYIEETYRNSRVVLQF